MDEMERRMLLMALQWPLVGIIVSVCFGIPAFVMTFFPEKAFRTRRKPRWVGAVLLLLSLLGLGVSVYNVFELRSELTKTRPQHSVTHGASH